MKHRLAHLDFLRGLAALLVCAEHLRAFLFVPVSGLKTVGIGERLFYFSTGLGHQAVMIFFVLSGFLVGGSVMTARQSGRWSWGGYLLRRLARLWVVLIPTLLLTLLWDKWGQHAGLAGYQGIFRDLYHSGPAPGTPADWHWMTLLGNVFFLQTICVNSFGTNSPLWSLANEFWYYLLFPLVWTVFGSGKWLARLAGGAVATALLWWLPGKILLGGLVWFMGAGVFVFIQSEPGRRWAAHPLWLGVSGLLALGLLGASRMGKLGGADDLLVGAGFALLIAALAIWPAKSRIYKGISAAVSEFSYTLYLAHFPILALFFFGFFKGRQLPPGIASAGWFLFLLSAVLIYATVVWWCFERNTERVRLWVQGKMQARFAAKD